MKCNALQIINILTLGSPDGIGCFFPKGFLGKINKPTGFDASASGTTASDASGPPKIAVQVRLCTYGLSPFQTAWAHCRRFLLKEF